MYSCSLSSYRRTLHFFSVLFSVFVKKRVTYPYFTFITNYKLWVILLYWILKFNNFSLIQFLKSHVLEQIWTYHAMICQLLFLLASKSWIQGYLGEIQCFGTNECLINSWKEETEFLIIFLTQFLCEHAMKKKTSRDLGKLNLTWKNLYKICKDNCIWRWRHLTTENPLKAVVCPCKTREVLQHLAFLIFIYRSFILYYVFSPVLRVTIF